MLSHGKIEVNEILKIIQKKLSIITRIINLIIYKYNINTNRHYIYI